MNLKLIIFDLDGTLAETREDIASAVNYTRLRYKLDPLSLQTVSGYVGNGIKKLIERSFPGFNSEEQLKALDIFKEYYAIHLTDKTFLYPGVAEFLQNNPDLDFAVLSNKSDEYTKEIVKQLKIESHFKIVLGANSTLPKKPEPDSIIYILKELNYSPHQAMIVGDTKFDILAGIAAGIETCAVTYGFRTREELSEQNPDYIIDSIDELSGII
jgi:phosphoglycolate phosphatase